MLKNLINFYLFSYARRRVKEIEETYANPLRLQESTLFSVLDKARYTEFARTYDFKSIKSITSYQKRIPLLKYDDIRQWIEKTIDGKPNVLWPGRIWNFALSSGTISGNKHIPISKERMIVNRRAAMDCLAFYLTESSDNSLLNGKFLFLGGSTSLKRLKSGALTGDLSGIAMRSMPLIARPIYEPDRQIAFMSDWEDKIDKIVQKDMGLDIRGISGVPSWLLVFFNRLLEEASKRKGRDIHTVAEVWPNFSLLVYGGVNFAPYKGIFNKMIGKKIYYLEVYPASEGFIAIQDRKDERGLLLMLDYDIFYEFVPEEEIGGENPTRLTIADVEIDKNYAIILTNNSGLYSYILGDTVKFIGLNPPRLVVTGRIGNFISAFGEHIIVEEAEDAVSYACEKTDAEVEEFTAAPFFPESPRELPYHQWLVEFRKNPKNLDEFAQHLDKRLRARSRDYDEHRGTDTSIGKPRVIKLKKRTFYDWMKSEGKLGGQHKVPRLKNDRTLADKLLR